MRPAEAPRPSRDKARAPLGSASTWSRRFVRPAAPPPGPSRPGPTGGAGAPGDRDGLRDADVLPTRRSRPRRGNTIIKRQMLLGHARRPGRREEARARDARPGRRRQDFARSIPLVVARERTRICRRRRFTSRVLRSRLEWCRLVDALAIRDRPGILVIRKDIDASVLPAGRHVNMSTRLASERTGSARGYGTGPSGVGDIDLSPP